MCNRNRQGVHHCLVYWPSTGSPSWLASPLYPQFEPPSYVFCPFLIEKEITDCSVLYRRIIKWSYNHCFQLLLIGDIHDLLSTIIQYLLRGYPFPKCALVTNRFCAFWVLLTSLGLNWCLFRIWKVGAIQKLVTWSSSPGSPPGEPTVAYLAEGAPEVVGPSPFWPPQGRKPKWEEDSTRVSLRMSCGAMANSLT